MIQRQHWFYALVSGVLLSLPWLIQEMCWPLFVAFVPLLIAEDQIVGQKPKSNSRSLYLLSFSAFLLWNLLATWWLGYVSVGGMLLIALLNSLLMAAIWRTVIIIKRLSEKWWTWISLPAIWLTFEFFHHHWTLQWPWLTLGNGFANSPEIIQWYEFTGVLGGSLWVILVNLLIYYLLKNLPDSTKQKVVFQGGFILVAILLPIIWSLCKYSGKIANVPSVEVVVIQPNIDPYTEKFSGISPENQVRKIVKLAETVVAETTQIVLAPETALPDLWEDSVQTTKSVLPVFDLLQKFPDVGFIAGALTKGKPAENEIRDETAHQSVNQRCAYDTFNSALMISNSGTQIGHKQILVNGVEKMPFQEYFSFFRKYMLQLGGTSGSLVAGEEPILFKTNQGIKIGAVICFESAFGQPFGKLINSGAQMLVVLTNDGWLKNSPGVWQHFGYSRLRAIETRRSVVRSANTGISGIIDLRGKIVKKTRTGRKVAFSGVVNLNGTSTFYSRYGDWIGWISSIFTGLILIFLWLSRDKKNPH